MLEVIACSIEDALEAEKGGADRLEIIRDFDSGGLSPSIELVREILNVVSIPIRVMVRENSGYGVVEESEINTLCDTAKELSKLNVDGLVLGFLREGEVDREITGRVLSRAPRLKATFHRAFEHLDSPLDALDSLKRLDQVDRILTSGGTGGWPTKIASLAALQRMAYPRFTVMAGGGLDKVSIRNIVVSTPIREIHVGSAARVPPNPNGAVSANKVRELVEIIRG